MPSVFGQISTKHIKCLYLFNNGFQGELSNRLLVWPKCVKGIEVEVLRDFGNDFCVNISLTDFNGENICQDGFDRSKVKRQIIAETFLRSDPGTQGRVFHCQSLFLKQEFQRRLIGSTIHEREASLCRNLNIQEIHMDAIADNRFIAINKRNFLPRHAGTLKLMFRKWRARQVNPPSIDDDNFACYPKDFFDSLGSNALQLYKMAS